MDGRRMGAHRVQNEIKELERQLVEEQEKVRACAKVSLVLLAMVVALSGACVSAIVLLGLGAL
jgi:hypothetical protein